MSNFNPLAPEALVTAEVLAEEEQVIVDAFPALGVATPTRIVSARHGLENLQWLVFATVPLQATE
ncbi:MAG: hypothetical protein ACRDTC_25905 [Pseudonocardiaceae bacterium]